MFTSIYLNLLFRAPKAYIEELDRFNTSSVINKVTWKEFNQKLQDEWNSSTLYVCTLQNSAQYFVH